jgi:hypothetical protein
MRFDEDVASGQGLQINWDRLAGCGTTLVSSCLMARFRNLLVHVYWKIDYGQVYDVITTRLEDLRAFRSAMAGLI